MPFLTDSFTDTDGTLLDNHVGEAGTPWVLHPSSTSTASIQNNRLWATGTPRQYYSTGSPTTAEYDVAATFVLLTDNNSQGTGITGRMDTTANTMYWARYDTTTNSYELRKFVAGAATSLGTFAATLATSTVRLEVRNATKKVFVDDVEVISSTDNAITGAGRPGVRFTGTGGNAVGVHIDSVTAYDPGDAPVPGAAVALAATSAGTSTTTGDLQLAVGLSAQSDGTSVTAGDVSVGRSLAATSTGASSTIGDLAVAKTFTAVTAGSSTTSGSVVRQLALATTSAGASTTTGSLSVTGAGLTLTGTTAGTSTTAASLTALRALAATSAGTSSTTAAVRALYGLSAASAGTSTTFGTLRALWVLTGLSVGASTTAGQVTVTGAVTAVGWLEAGLSVSMSESESSVSVSEGRLSVSMIE